MSENSDFAEAIRKSGILFLGPSPESMAVLGNKRSAKDYLLEYAPEVPLIPGYNGSEQSIDRLMKEAAEEASFKAYTLLVEIRSLLAIYF